MDSHISERKDVVVSGTHDLRTLIEELAGANAARADRLTPCLVIAAHPDDETLGASWVLQHVENVYVLHLTDGAPRDPKLRSPRALSPREFYAAQRAEEARRALALAGLPATRIRCFGLPDQDASHHLVALTQRVQRVLEALHPAVVITHAYEGGHPDHDAAAFAVQIACERLRALGGPTPHVLEMTSYHRCNGALRTGAFLPASTREAERVLSSRERELKARMLACFVTQSDVTALFDTHAEHFRAAPRYDFSAPPTSETLHYEAQGWPLDGPHWRTLAAHALERFQTAA